MKTHATLALVALLLLEQPAAAQAPPRKDLQVLRDVERAVTGYGWFTIFDDISARVEHGVVTLTGRVTMPYKRAEIVSRVSLVNGLEQLVDRIEVLPLSRFDDDLRLRLARAIYGNANFSTYAMMANPPIHIVVERGRVTLTGVVQSDLDRLLARSLAAQPGVMSVVNNLRTVSEVRTADEKS
jgi:hyperosmotically inducible periplasmic protein